MKGFCLLLVPAVLLLACDGTDDSSARATATGEACASAERAYVYNLDMMERVHDVAGSGRVPLGLINTVAIERANAWFDGIYAGEALPSSWTLELSVVAQALRDELVAIDGKSYVSYEWWFAIVHDVDAEAVEGEPDPDVRVAIREERGGDWAVYVDEGSGWKPVPGAAVNIGKYEVSATVPLAESWGVDRETTRTFFRAFTRSEGFIADDPREFGWVFPEDMSWREVLWY